jgi:hypothetical protein
MYLERLRSLLPFWHGLGKKKRRNDDDNGLLSTPVYSKAANGRHGQKMLYCTAGEAMGVALQRRA